jgi:hypothetical protein
MNHEDPPAPVEDAPKAGDTYAQLADPRIIEAVERRANRRGAREWKPPVSPREPRLHVNPEDWRAGGLLEVREREGFAPELKADLHELTPQASLRDLYRPVHVSRWVEREPRAEDLDPGGRRWLADARAAQRLEPVPRIVPLVRDVVAEQARRRAMLAERWLPAKRDDEERTPFSMPDDSDAGE